MKSLIGNTPLVKINYEYEGNKKYVYVKLEYYNLTGSIKDRMVYYILNKEIENGNLNKNNILVEATSGNTGISLSALGALFKHEVHIFMPDWVSKERQDLIKMYGANVHLVSRKSGGFKKAILLAEKFSSLNNGFIPHQFSNKYNVETYYKTFGKEILKQLKNTKIDAFVSGIGTGGTLIGTIKRLKMKFPLVKSIAIEPDTLPIISKGIKSGSHKIDGIGDDFIPEIVDLDSIDKVVLINDDDAINMARKISKELGLGVGISSGANFLGCALVSDKNNSIVTVFPDDNKKYISTHLKDKIDNNKSFVSNKIKLIDYEIVS